MLFLLFFCCFVFLFDVAFFSFFFLLLFLLFPDSHDTGELDFLVSGYIVMTHKYFLHIFRFVTNLS